MKTKLQNKVQLITYPDSLGGDLKNLKLFLDTHLKEVIGGIHILPFYPSSADRGFAPLTHLEVEPFFGNWGDIKAISAEYDLVADFTVNHLSSESHQFQDYIEQGEDSKYKDMFLTKEKFFARYGVGDESLEHIYRPRPGLPFTKMTFVDGIDRQVWTSWTPGQIDLDVEAGKTREMHKEAIEWLAMHGVKLIRLDAVGYCVKRPCTSCFMLPETFEYMRWLREQTPADTELLAEIHDAPERQLEILKHNCVEWVYDFSLPFLTVNAIRTKHVGYLVNWIEQRSPRMITNLDTHDGIGVIDVAGLLPDMEIDDTIAWIEEQGANQSVRASGKNAENLDVYQVNCTYYSAVHENDDAYILARALQLFLPGIPQVYYVGLLAGTNDYETLGKTMHGRDINRHNYAWEEAQADIQKPVVQRLLKLMKLRSNHPAFSGEFSYEQPSAHELLLSWKTNTTTVTAHLNFMTYTTTIQEFSADNLDNTYEL